MLSYWFAAPVSYWWPLAFAIVFAIGAVVAIFATLARRAEEQNAAGIAALYGVGLGLVAVTEFVMYLQYAGIWSLATSFAVTGAMGAIMIVAAVIAVVALITGAVLQVSEERNYQLAHPAQ